MFICMFCKHEFNTKVAFARHTKLHKNAPNQAFTCGVPDCAQSFRKFSACKSHIYRDHKEYQRTSKGSQFQLQDSIICHIEGCYFECQNLKGLISHLKGHLQGGRAVVCLFRECSKTFCVKSTFASHISRAHKNSSVDHLVSTVVPALATNPTGETPSTSQSFDR